MTTSTISPNMALVVPTPGQEAGPLYATDISNDLVVIDAHRHTGAANNDGLQINSAGIAIDADLSWNSHNLTTLRSLRLANQSSILSGVADIGCFYEKSGDAYYNNSAGQAIQLTIGSVINFLNVLNYSSISFSGNHTINSTDVVTLLLPNVTTTPSIITLPDAGDVPAGRLYIIKDVNGHSQTNNITINPIGGQTIENTTNYVMKDNYTAISLVSDGGSNWTLYQYDRKIYFAGETLKLTGGASLTSDTSSPVVLGGTLQAGATTLISTLGVTSLATLSSGLLSGGNIQIDKTLSLPVILQNDLTTNSSTGQRFTIHAQNATGATSVGGQLVLAGGTGTSTDGGVSIHNGASSNTSFNSTGVLLSLASLGWSSIVASPTLTQSTASSDVATNNITIAPQAPFSTASGSNRIPGSINLSLSGPTNGGTTRGAINFVDATVPFLTIYEDSSSNAIITNSGGGGQAMFLQANGVTKIELSPTGLGFFAASPVTKPTVTGAKGGNAALGSLLTALANLGLVTDSTSA